MIYIVKENGNTINHIEIQPEQVEAFSTATGWVLEPYTQERTQEASAVHAEEAERQNPI